jgi:diguanylate cyclase (GGDEF)-like protein
MLQPVDAFLEGVPKPFLVAFGTALVMTVGGIDLLSASAGHFSFLYLGPIAFVSWYVGRMAGGGIALLSLLYGFFAAFASVGISRSWDQLSISAIVFFLEAIGVAQLREKLNNLSRMATLDALTGLPNAQAFFELMARETTQCGGQNPLTLVYVDLGGLERINRSVGHAAGDQVLCTMAQVIKQNIQRRDLIGRVGGTTFALLLPNVDAESVKTTIRQLQTRLYEARRKSLLAVTFTISVMSCADAPRTVAGLMLEAETRLRRSKARHHDALNIVQIDSLSTLH